jgi:ATP-dependent helicase HrpA
LKFRVVDENGKILDIGRNLQQFQEKYAVKAVKSFDQIAADELNFTGCIQWAFDDLPETYTFSQNGQQFIGFPAIVDEGESVGVRIFDTQNKAEAKHRDGVVRLVQLQLRKECAYVLKNMPYSPATELAYNRLPVHPIIKDDSAFIADFKNDVLYSVFYNVFAVDKNIRTQNTFEVNLRVNRPQLITVSNEVGNLLLEIMAIYSDIKLILNCSNNKDVRTVDINSQLDMLIYKGFIRNTPVQQLRAIPRYLKAITFRLQKSDSDRQKIQEISKYVIRFWQDIEKKSKQNLLIPEHVPFRWALEEFRVSLFAQQLKTAYPISAKRLDKMWEEKA